MSLVRRSNTRSRFAPYARYARQAVSLGKTVAKHFKGKPKQKYNNPQGKDEAGAQLGVITNQYDTALAYKKKKKKSPKSKKFAKKVMRIVNEKLIGDQNLLRSLIGTLVTTAGQQSINSYAYWGIGAAGASNYDDVAQMFLGYQGAFANNSTNMILPRSCTFDWVVTNFGVVTLILKVWTVYAKKDMDNPPSVVWANENIHQTALPTAATMAPGFVTLLPGANEPMSTPFQSTEFCRSYTVSEMRKYVLSPGQIASWRETAKPPKRIVNQDTLQTNFRKGTKFTMLSVYGIANIAFDTKAIAFPQAGLNVAIHKSYKFGVLRDQYSTASAINNTL